VTIKIDALELPDDGAYEVWPGYLAPVEMPSAVTLGGRFLYEFQPVLGGQEIVLAAPDDVLWMPAATWDALFVMLAAPAVRLLNYRDLELPVVFDYQKSPPITASQRLYGSHDGARIGWTINLRTV
jgi:hypothetical protein